jgi:hypothetical protein
MTSSGRTIAALLGIVIAFMLPKRVECGFPGGDCGRVVGGERCVAYELEPWGFYLIETLAKRDVGFAYKREEECR